MASKYSLVAAICWVPLMVQAASGEWQAITFGQSTDINFSSNVLSAKVGINQVEINGRVLTPTMSADLSQPVTIESRGGKIANTHDGLTFFYTTLPAGSNFNLEALVTVEQFGPENGARPAAQEGAGLMVRDILGPPRQQPLKEGYEEFPTASNMVMNAIMTQDRKDHHRVQIQTIRRQGVSRPWGNAGADITRIGYQQEIDIQKTPRFRMKLVRTDTGFIAGWAPEGSDKWIMRKVSPADIVTVQDPHSYHLGFFAARNARITISDASLTTSPAQTVASPAWQPKTWPLVMQIASSEQSPSSDYIVQARANYDGDFRVLEREVVIGEQKGVKAGKMFRHSIPLKGLTALSVTFTPDDKRHKPVRKMLNVLPLSVPDTLYVSPEGAVDNPGTVQSPLDLASAINRVAPGGKVILTAGHYPQVTLPFHASGLPGREKQLEGQGKVVIHGMRLNASYWQIRDIDITDNSLRIQGSHNLIERVTAYHNSDTGIQISSPAGIGRPLWASYNRIVNSTSYQNEDPGKINADGFAVKMRVGEGNRLEGCYAWGNIDDGYDLFNKIEDGPNGAVIIENSIARNNTSNGFKLGGEGQPVAHQIRNSIAIGNHLDGFSDNFNPGPLQVVNNIAVDNRRFNFIFRPSPYGGPQTQGHFQDNLSLRSDPGRYDDAVTGNIDSGNVFIENGESRNRDGRTLAPDLYQSLTLPEPLLRKADGSFDTADFLVKS